MTKLTDAIAEGVTKRVSKLLPKGDASSGTTIPKQLWEDLKLLPEDRAAVEAAFKVNNADVSMSSKRRLNRHQAR